MLSAERRDKVWHALTRQVTSRIITEPDIDNYETIYKEQLITQQRLEEIEFNASLEPCEFVGINQVFLPDKNLLTQDYEGIIVNVMGMPNSGKSIQLNVFKKLHPDIHLTREYGKESKKILLKKKVYSPKYRQIMQLGLRSKELLDVFNEAEVKGINPEVVMDRGLIDIGVWDRSYLLNGTLRADTFNATSPFHFLEFTCAHETGIRMGFVICLTTTQKSLWRSDPNEKTYPLQKSPEIMTIKYLNTLYEQYARFYSEARNHTNLTGDPTTFAYACLDMNGDDYENNQRLLNNTLLQMFNHFKENGN